MRISELRRNPEHNPKQYSYDILANEYDKATDYIGSIKNLFVSFTEINKLGLNPSSKMDDTPLGIFAYPSEYLLKIKDFSRVPFGTNPYINIFQVEGNFIDNSLNDDQVEEYLDQLKYQYDSWLIDEAADQYINIKNPLKRLWLTTSAISNGLSKKPNIIKWNTIFRSLEIDGVIDLGSSIIHRKQPIQAVFFSLKPIQNIIRFPNRLSPSPR